MLLIGYFTFPPTIGATVGPKDIKERVAAAYRTVAQHEDAIATALYAIEGF